MPAKGVELLGRWWHGVCRRTPGPPPEHPCGRTHVSTTVRGAGPRTPRLSATHLVALAAGVVAGLGVSRGGRPAAPAWDTPLDALPVPTALTVGAGVVVVVIAATSGRAWRVVDMTVAAV